MDSNFNLVEIDKTFASYKNGKIFDGVVVIKRKEGVIFNIGGKNDTFIPKDDFDDFEDVKIGERFKVLLGNKKNDDGLLIASKSQAENLIIGTQNAEKLKLGSKFTFVATSFNQGLCSNLGEYKVFIPFDEISLNYIHNPKNLIGKQFEAVVTEYDKPNKKIIASIKLLQEQIKLQCETLFWKSIFINKIVKGMVKKILPYGIFVDVDGVDCFAHISNLSYEKIGSPRDVLKEGDILNFKVIKLDREQKKVELGLKQLEKSPKEKAFEEIVEGEIYDGVVIKLLSFGALIKLENGATGLLHISNATDKNDKNIYEIVRVDDKVKVKVIALDTDNQKISFALVN